MCQFFSFVTDPINHPAEYYYFDWDYRKANLDDDGTDSHSHICAYYQLNEDRCNKYEYNPLTKRFEIDQINSERDDSKAAEKWAKRIDFKTIVEPLIIKPIVNPFELPAVEKVTDEHLQWLKEWDSVRSSVWDSIRDSVGDSIRDSVGDSVWDSIRDSVRSSVWDSVWDSLWASLRDSLWASLRDSVRSSLRDSVWVYVSTFFDIQYEPDFSSAVKLWEVGLVPSFDGKVWRLLTGKNAKIVYEERER
jgi:hypothetical protein